MGSVPVRMAKSVCIIGAGPAGIIAAKTFLRPEGAFKITVFEQKPRIGGLWPLDPTDTGLINPSMSTNLSRHTVCFSDEAWPVKDNAPAHPLFPKASHVGQYLQRYVNKYLSTPSVEIRTSCRVEQVSIEDGADGSKKWHVYVQNRPPISGGTESPVSRDASADPKLAAAQREDLVFDHVILSSGFFGQPKTPEVFKNTEGSSIPIIHSSDFNGLKELLKGSTAPPGKILVVGGSMSGAETSAAVATQLSSEVYSPGKSDIDSVEKYTVHHVTSKPFWTLPFFLPLKAQLDEQENGDKIFNPAPQFLPLDFVMFNLANRPPEERLKNRSGIISPEGALKSHIAFQVLNGGKSNIRGSQPDDKDTDAPWLAISDTYSSFVQSGAITTTQGRVKSLADDNRSVIVETPSSLETIHNISAIIFATGFDSSSSLSFLTPSLLSTLGHDPSTPDLPLDLSLHSTIHPSLPSLGFVGFYRGPYWGVAEQQAAVLHALWLPHPPPALSSALADAASIIPTFRKCHKENPERLTQFPMGDYIHIMESLRQLQGFEPVVVGEGSCVPVTPALYTTNPQPDAREEATKALRLAVQDIRASQSGKFVAKAIFRGLQGNWTLNRTIKSNISTYPSGSFDGTAKFHRRNPTGEGFDEEYLYIEDGDFKTDTGLQFRATRRYVYRYAEKEDALSVWFVKTDNKTVDYLFHELEMLCPHPAPGGLGEEEALSASCARLGVDDADEGGQVAEKDRRWRAKAHHLCIDDTYDPEYEFKFRGVEVETWRVGYHVKGPQKDYWIGSAFSR